jgi:catechol 2,3-dioxygenase-like lactoylglutathione lyase family enzyme
MKRLHLHVAVDDLAASRAFYATLFGAEPSVVEADYAKWMLDDPRVNFAISQRGRAGGVDHLGMQVETSEELAEIATRLKAARQTTVSETDTACCYARSDKEWAVDPQGIRWESFLTHGQITTYGEGSQFDVAPIAAEPAASACCGPAKAEPAPVKAASACCG